MNKPTVLINRKSKRITIVYNNKTEVYKLEDTYKTNDFNPFAEIVMAENNEYKKL